MEALSGMAGGIVHDFNNVLSAILGHASLLGESPNLDPDDMESTIEIQRAVKRAAGVTRRLLTFTAKHVAPVEILDLNEAVRDSLDLVRRLAGPGVEVAYSPAQYALHVQADPIQLRNTLANLVTNADEAMSGVGTLSLSLSARDLSLDEAVLAGVPPGPTCVLEVADMGVGIAADAVQRIFDPFFSTKAKSSSSGLGLGLASVYGFAKRSGGCVQVESSVGEGSVFRILLPRAEATPPGERDLTPPGALRPPPPDPPARTASE